MATITTTLKAIDEISPTLSKINASIGGTISSVHKLDSALSSVNGSSMNSVTGASNSASKSVQHLGQTAQSTAGSFATVKQASEKLRFTGNVFKDLGRGIETVGKAGMGVTAGLVGIGATAVKTASSFIALKQQSEVVFSKMLGGAEQAKQMYSDVLDVAQRSPFPQEAFLNAAKSLVGVGVSAENTTKYLEAISDATAAFGGDAHNIDQLAFAFRRVATNGRISMLEVNMLGDDGVNALEILGNHFGLAADEMRDMIANGVVPADQALDILSKGIEEGSNGINGFIPAVGGLAQAMKGKTLPGAFDSLHTAIRNFSLSLLDMDPQTDSGSQHIKQLTATIMGINSAIKNSAPLFRGIGDAVSEMLTKLIGANPVFNEQTGQWEQTGGILSKINDYLTHTDPDKLKELGNQIIKLGTVAPILFTVGKGIETVGITMERLSRQKEVLQKLIGLFNRLKGETAELPQIEAPSVTVPQPKVNSSTVTAQAPNVKLLQPPALPPPTTTPIESYIDKLQTDAASATTQQETIFGTFFSRMKEKFSVGVENFKSTVSNSFNVGEEAGNSLKNYLSSYEKNVQGFNTDGVTLESNREKNGGKKGALQKVNEALNPEGKSFKERAVSSVKSTLPEKSKSPAQKFTSLFTALPKALGNTKKGTVDVAKQIIPENTQSSITGALEKLTAPFKNFFGMIGKFFGQIGSLFTRFAGMITGIFAKIAGFIMPFIQSLATALAPVIGILGSLTSGALSLGTAILMFGGGVGIVLAVVGLLTGALGKLGGGMQGVQAVMDFFKNLQTTIATSTATIIGNINTFVESFTQNFVGLAQAGANMIVQFIVGIGTTLPQLIASGIQIGLTLLSGFLQMIPTMITAGFEAIKAIGQGIIDNWPTIMAAFGNALSTIQQAVQDNWPKILDAGHKIIEAICNGISELIPMVLGWAGQIVSGIATWLWDNKWQILEAGKNLVMALINGLVSVGGLLLEAVVNIGKSIVDGIWKGIENAWNAFTSWVSGLFSGLIDTVKGIFGINSPSKMFSDIGGNLVEGLKKGVEKAWTSVKSWASGIFEKLPDWVKHIFGVNSPSKEFYDIGINLVEGLKNGIEDGWSKNAEYFSSVGDEFIDALKLNKTAETGSVDYSETLKDTNKLFDTLRQDILNGYESTVGAVVQQNSLLANGTIDTFTAMQTNVPQSVSQMAATMGSTLSTIPGLFSTTFGQAENGAAGDLNGVENGIYQKMTEMASGLQPALDVLSSMLTNVFGAQVASQVIAQLNYLKDTCISIWTTLSNTIVAITNVFISTVNALITLFSSQFIAILNNLYTQTVSILQALSQQALAIIQTLVNNIIRTINVLPGEFHRVGVEMMSQLRAGIDSQTAAVLDTTNQLVQKLKDTFIQGLGIHSPSKFMTYVGQMMAAGIIEGLSAGQIKSFVEHIVDQMKASFNNGKFDPNELVKFLGDDTLKLIAYLTGVDTSGISTGQMVWPIPGYPFKINSPFGGRSSPGGIGSTNHAGVDLYSGHGNPIVAALPGVVEVAGWYYGYGNAVKLDHGNGVETLYGHFLGTAVNVGQTVAAGQTIGYSDSTGNSTGDHLHFEVRQNGTAVNPVPYLQGATIAAGSPLVSAIQAAYSLWKYGITPGAWTGGAGADVAQMAITQALAILGLPMSYLPDLMYAAYSESGYDPGNVNRWDSNWRRGTPSIGLFQTIQPTFDAYKYPGFNNIYNPLDNTLAAIRYMIGRYGSIDAVVNPRRGRWYGYAVGTRKVPEDMLAMIHQGEAILPKAQNPYSESGGNYLREIGDIIGQQVLNQSYMPELIVSTPPVEYIGESSSPQLDYHTLSANMARDSVMSTSAVTTTNGGNVTIEVTNNINNSGDLDIAEDRIINAVYKGLSRANKATGGVKVAY